jgi:hypothetical protein
MLRVKMPGIVQCFFMVVGQLRKQLYSMLKEVDRLVPLTES